MASIVSAGTTSATALNMSADTTGILQLASNNGTVALTVDTSQNIGVGTTSQYASSKLSINGSGAFNTSGVDGTYTSFVNAVYSGNTAQYGSIQHSMSSISTNAGFRFLGGGAGSGTTQQKMYDMTRGQHVFYITDSEVLRINSSGYVGIATSSPVALLDMNRGVFGNRLPNSAGSVINFSGGYTGSGSSLTATMLTVNFSAASYFSCTLHVFSIGYQLNGGSSANSGQVAAYDIINIIRQSSIYSSYNITRVSGPSLASGISPTWTVTGAIASNVFTLTGSTPSAGQTGWTFGGYMVYGGQGTSATNIILTTNDGATTSTWGA
jgi:hypothetical protein